MFIYPIFWLIALRITSNAIVIKIAKNIFDKIHCDPSKPTTEIHMQDLRMNTRPLDVSGKHSPAYHIALPDSQTI